ncbi:MAG: hypothetical protein M5U30_07635 [Burkholderiaceae bacterium]|nr:hypothetical protein [Burkholderiaceae bacterium]
MRARSSGSASSSRPVLIHSDSIVCVAIGEFGDNSCQSSAAGRAWSSERSTSASSVARRASRGSRVCLAIDR